LANGHLGDLFAGLGRINNKFEWVRVLVLLRQFQIDEPFDPLREVEVVHEELRPVLAAEMLNTLQVRLPVANALVIKAVDDVFAQKQIRQIDIRIAGKQIRRNQVRRVYRCPVIATTNRTRNLLA
jgi:hypothetical protein